MTAATIIAKTACVALCVPVVFTLVTGRIAFDAVRTIVGSRL